jgi:hypothetical protein
VTPELERQGHHVIVPELGFDTAEATAETLAADVEAVITDPSDTVLVSHSAAGLVAPMVAEQLPLREMILVASMLPAVGLSFREQQAEHPASFSRSSPRSKPASR